MKFANPLSEEQDALLNEMMHTHPSQRTRQRAHCIRLSARGMRIPQLAQVFFVNRDTISGWIDAWNASGADALVDKPRCGRPTLLDEQDLECLGELVQHYPQQSQLIHAKLCERTGKDVSQDTVIRALKKKASSTAVPGCP